MNSEASDLTFCVSSSESVIPWALSVDGIALPYSSLVHPLSISFERYIRAKVMDDTL